MADAVVWPFPGAGDLNWQAEWLTDVMQPPTGGGQYRALRAAPRVVVTMDGLVSGADRQWLEQALAERGWGQWWLPLSGAGAVLAADVLPLSDGLPLGDGLGLFGPGRALLVDENNPRNHEVVDVDALVDGSLHLSAPLGRAHRAGTRVLPLVRARLLRLPDLSRFTGNDLPWRAEFSLLDDLPIVADAGDEHYRSHPLLSLTVDWSVDPTWQSSRMAVISDEGVARPFIYDTLGRALSVHGRQITAVGLSQVRQLLSLLWALAGRATPIWVASLGQDMSLAANAASNASSIDVAWCGLPTGSLPAGRRDVCITLADGSQLLRRVTAVSQLGNGNHRLALNATLGKALAPAAVRQLAWLSPCTLGADVVRINWWRYDVASVQLVFNEVADEL
ncbi:hypothetical protein [Stenotrophomonas sp. PS02298]|uniref:hypothetical protein n=1 Tax=Stenotrophomonas sp. PS02298 TaxID=2991424 RepID=UPI00249CB501|nr:hypothetical protein [Stenotrophomonas sp. PS02298]